MRMRLCAVLLWGLSMHVAGDAVARNVVLFVADDLSCDATGCYGNPVVKTPAIDALAREGTRFTHAFSTTASCSPSRSVMLTGKHNHSNGQYGLQHAVHHFESFANVSSLPKLLSEAGYRTLAAGKVHVGPESVYPFDAYRKVEAPVAMAEACRDFLAAEDTKPFFLLFATVEPHRPFHRGGSDPVEPSAVVVPPYLPDIPECREELAQYYASIQRMDAGLGRLVELLKETGKYEETLIIFLSDNGAPWPGAKTTVYEPGIRLPCIVRAPGQTRRGVVNDAMVSWVDITPTVLEYAGVLPPRAGLQGRSFLSLLAQGHAEGWDEVYASHTFHEVTMYYPMRVVRERQYKLIWNIAHGLEFPFASDLWESRTWQTVLRDRPERYGARTVEAYLHRPEFELYDLERDPQELQNLAGDVAYLDRLHAMQEKLRAFQKRTGDPWRLKWERE
jgi:N-sulfoglucosamine sulfohydrolase